MSMSLMKQDDDKGNSVLRTMMQLDDEMIQEAMNNMRQAFDENGKKFGRISCHLRRWNNGYMKTETQPNRQSGTARTGNTRGGTTRTRGEAVQRRSETNHD